MSMEYQRFFRSRDDRMIAGICGGLGEYFNIDPTLIRLAFVFLALVGFAGPAIIAYIVMLIVVPETPLLGAKSTEAMVQQPDPMSASQKEDQKELDEDTV